LHLDQFPEIDTICGVMNVAPAGLAVWAGKPDKIGRRLFAYASGASGDLVAKVALENDLWLGREHRAIVQLGQHLAGTRIADALPHLVRYEHPVMVQRLVPGRSLTELLLRGRRRPDVARRGFERAVSWLGEFHRATASTESGSWRHGDFKPSNVLLTPRTIGVIDWELADTGWQEFDFWHLATYAGLICAGANTWAAFKRVFIDPSWISDMVADGLRRYAPPAGIGDPYTHFRRYLDDVLYRRAGLGLSNEGYFLNDIRSRLERERPATFLGL
jgi:hypothetical protein